NTNQYFRLLPHKGEFQNARILVWLGTASGGIAFMIGLLRIRVQPINNSRQCRTAQFFNLIISFSPPINWSLANFVRVFSVVSLLSSVAIWADFLRHMDPLYPQPAVDDLGGGRRSQTDIGKPDGDRPTTLPDNTAVFANHKHDRVHLALGWAYWCCVGAVLCLFLCNLIYLMRKDCEPNRIDLVDNGNAL
ncbi:hypothetical protein P879_00623, partial [Paragonimus westermani]